MSQVDAETLRHRETVRAMAARGMSQRDIADAVGISRSTVNRLLRLDETPEGDNAIAAVNRKLHAWGPGNPAWDAIPDDDSPAVLDWPTIMSKHGARKHAELIRKHRAEKNAR